MVDGRDTDILERLSARIAAALVVVDAVGVVPGEQGRELAHVVAGLWVVVVDDEVVGGVLRRHVEKAARDVSLVRVAGEEVGGVADPSARATGAGGASEV